MTQKPPVQAERLSELIQKELPIDPVWIGPAILPKRCKMIFGGGAFIGKSFVLLSLARALALGEKPFAAPRFTIERPVRTLLIEHELKPYGLQQRVKKIFEDIELSRIDETLWYVSGQPRAQFSTLEGREILKDLVEEIKPEVLILDPIGKMHYFDENDNGAISRLMYQLDLLLEKASEWGMSIVFSHHFGKPPVQMPGMMPRDDLDAYNFRGASKWKDDPDVRVTMKRMERLQRPYEAWRIKTRWMTRQGEQMPDMYFLINDKGDNRVIFEKEDRVPGGLPQAPNAPLPEKPKEETVVPPPPPTPEDAGKVIRTFKAARAQF